MFNLDNIGLETAFNVVRILGFLLICALGGVAWLVYFLAQEQKKPVFYPMNKTTGDGLQPQTFTISGVYKMPTNANILDDFYQSIIAMRWANPDYEVVGKARRVPFSQQKIDEDHGEALRMVAAGGSLTATASDGITRHFKLRRPVPQANVDIAHIEALKMIRRGEYD
jgi:hypothetical protein